MQTEHDTPRERLRQALVGLAKARHASGPGGLAAGPGGATMTEEQTADLIARHAALEQLVLHLAAHLAGGAGQPREAALALLDDLRADFAGGEPGQIAFIGRARSAIDALAPRLLRLLPPDDAAER